MALDARLDLVHAHVLRLYARVGVLEQTLQRSGAVLEAAPSLPTTPALPTTPTQPTSSATPTATMASANPSFPTAAAPSAASSMTASLEPNADPIRVLAIAGGVALLIGLAIFVGFVIEQGWLTPLIRFFLGAVVSAGLTAAAWPIARRGHEAVAGALGGAGLGGWFTAWLLARHAHELVSAPLTFLALGAGAAACMLIADRLRLRLMAVLATLAACATPVLVSAHGEHLHELMVYQLLVIAAALVLDLRRRWAELPTIALLSTWLLGARWAAEHLHGQGVDNLGVVLWAGVLLLTSAASAWRWLIAPALRQTPVDEGERAHAVVRLLIAGVACWLASAWAFGPASANMGGATLLLATWHLVLGALLSRPRAGAGITGLATIDPDEAPVGRSFLVIGWVQALIAGPLLAGNLLTSVVWWIALAMVAVALPWSALRRIRGGLLMLPVLAAVVAAVVADASWSLGAGLLAAALPLAASLWPRADEPQQARPVLWLSLTATVLWAAVIQALGPEAIAVQLTWSLVPALVVGGWALARPTRPSLDVAGIHLGLGLLGSVAAVVQAQAFAPGLGAARLGLATPALGLALLGATLIGRSRSAARLELERRELDDPATALLGVVVAGLMGLLALLSVAVGVDVLGSAGRALGQVGYTLAIAGTALGLLVAGLRLHQSSWRHLALAGLGFAALKVVFFDLATAAVVWRALSFVGLGLILIAGALAYSRARARWTVAHSH